MDFTHFYDYCLLKRGVEATFPFDENTLVMKVCGKMFAATDVDQFESINLKCDPELAVEYREKYMSVLPGYHMNKKHWNTVVVNGDVHDVLLLKMVDDSYDLVVQSLPKRVRDEMQI
jgi:predicted DNA-binding protein (MmcQ/YjbR family)